MRVFLLSFHKRRAMRFRIKFSNCATNQHVFNCMRHKTNTFHLYFIIMNSGLRFWREYSNICSTIARKLGHRDILFGFGRISRLFRFILSVYIANFTHIRSRSTHGRHVQRGFRCTYHDVRAIDPEKCASSSYSL